eukprot:403348398
MSQQLQKSFDHNVAHVNQLQKIKLFEISDDVISSKKGKFEEKKKVTKQMFNDKLKQEQPAYKHRIQNTSIKSNYRENSNFNELNNSSSHQNSKSQFQSLS